MKVTTFYRCNMHQVLEGRIGIALGSGAARGWAHIGVLKALESEGILPEIVCGSSVGAVVGAAFASGRLESFEEWVHTLDRTQVVRNFDVAFRGGLIKAERFFEYMSEGLPDCEITSMPRPFAAVATDLETGREIWLRKGSLHEALRASVAMPGLIIPVAKDQRWLVDGGLTNPVPISLCRALGADSVIAVDLNTTLLGRRITSPDSPQTIVENSVSADEIGGGDDDVKNRDSGGVRSVMQSWASELRERLRGNPNDAEPGVPSIYDVVANSINIMQVHIARSRMAGDPPELLVTPRLADFGLLDIDRAKEAIEEGRRALMQSLASRA